MKLNEVGFFLICSFAISTTYAEQVTWEKLEKLAECHTASKLIEIDATIRGDYKTYESFHKYSKIFWDSYYSNSSKFNDTNSIATSQKIYELFNGTIDKYKYMNDYSQQKFAIGVLKNLDCLRLAQ